MLVEFSVKNWRSIKEAQTLSMVMNAGGELTTQNTFLPNAPSSNALLRSVAIYGPNAAGKSNFIKAMKTMEEIVTDSASGQRGDSLPAIPFLLDSACENEPTEFEVTFIANNVRYQYGFSVTKERVVEEWLLAFPNGRAQRWIGRQWDSNSQSYSWDKMTALTGKKQLWQDSTRANALFLSTAVQLNSHQLQPVYDWFKETLRITGVGGWSPDFTAEKCSDITNKESILDFLKAADLDITDLDVRPEKISLKHLPKELPDEMKKEILNDIGDHNILNVKTVHRSVQGKLINFDLREESDGTQKLFTLAGPWLDVLKCGYVLFVDELHDNLHPKMVKFLVDLFHNEKTNPNNAQLIFTTHETSILNQDIFRRDQVWFCEKDSQQASKLYPLSDFSPRKGREDLEASYLAGRYGALPFLRNISTLKGA